MNQFKHDIREKDYHLNRNASEIPDKFQNKQLTDIISVLNKSLEDEKNKNNELKRENSEMKKELMNKSQSLKKFEKEIIQLKQIELKQNSTIKSLQENIEKYRQTFLAMQSRSQSSNQVVGNSNSNSKSAEQGAVQCPNTSNSKVAAPLSAADEVFNSPTGSNHPSILFSEKSSNQSNSKKDKDDSSSSFMIQANGASMNNNQKKVPERKINLNSSQHQLKQPGQTQQLQHQSQHQQLRSDSVSFTINGNNNNQINSYANYANHCSSQVNSKTNLHIQKNKSLANTPISRGHSNSNYSNINNQNNNGLNNQTSSFTASINCIVGQNNGIGMNNNSLVIQNGSFGNGGITTNNQLVNQSGNNNKENQINSLLELKNYALQQKKDILNNSLSNRKKIYNKRGNLQNNGQIINFTTGGVNNQRAGSNNNLNENESANNSINLDLDFKSEKSFSIFSKAGIYNGTCKDEEMLQQMMNQQQPPQSEEEQFQQEKILKEKQQNQQIKSQNQIDFKQQKLQELDNLAYQVPQPQSTIQQQQLQNKSHQSQSGSSLSSSQGSKNNQQQQLAGEQQPSRQTLPPQHLMQKELSNDNQQLQDYQENIQEDIDEAANLEKLSGSHFKINVKESCKDLHVRTDFYFSKKEAPHSFQAKEGDHEQPPTPSRVDNFDSILDPKTTSIIQEQSPVQQQMQQPIMQSGNSPIAQKPLSHQLSMHINQLQNLVQNNQQPNQNPQNLQQQQQQQLTTERHQSLNEYSIINNKMKNFSKNYRKMSSEPVEKKMKNKSSMKMPGRMKRHLEEPQSVDNSCNLQDACAPVSAPSDIGSHLFEALMVFGPDKSELKTLQAEQRNQDDDEIAFKNLSPQLYYKFPQLCDIDKGKENVMPHFVFPFGVETMPLSITDSLSQINEIIFSNNKYEANNNCFVFVIKTDDSYKKKSTKFSKLPEHLQLLEICNPSHLLYGICFKTKELIEYTDSSNLMKSIQKDQNIEKSQHSQRSIWATQKLFCILTYFPFIQFFLETIASILNQLKMQRLEYYTSHLEQIKENQNIVYNFESEFFNNFISKECQHIIDELNKISLPSLNNKIQLNLNNDFIQFYIPSKEQARHLEAGWSSSLVLSNLDQDLFTTLLLAILLEHSIVFVSSNSALLSATLLVFHSLIKPFKWPHPLVFNLPDSFMHLLDSPFPIFVGLNKDKTFVTENGLPEMHRNCVFVLLDSPLNNNQQYNNINDATRQKQNKSNGVGGLLANNGQGSYSQIEILNSDLIQHIKEGPNVNSLCQLLKIISPFFDYLYESTQIQNGGNVNYSSSQPVPNHQINSHITTGLLTSQKGSQQTLLSQLSRTTKSMASSRANINSNALIGYQQNRKMPLIACPTQEQRQACDKILQAVSEFIRHDIIEMLPTEPSYINPQKKMLDFMFISDAMIKSKGYDDSFMKKFPKTQLFTYFLEEFYDKVKDKNK